MSARIFYVMGPSGSGKDSLLRICRERLMETPCLVAHRYITREPELEGENHIYLSPREFENRVQMGAFAMHWKANGHRYGIGQEVNQWLGLDINVLVNGSRAYVERAREQYQDKLVPIMLQVDPDRLRQRLIRRGRETSGEIAARVERARQLAQNLPRDVAIIDNNRDLDTAVQQLMSVVLGVQKAS